MRKIRVGGFSGTADTTWVADARTTTGKSNGGVPCVATSHRSETTVAKVISVAAENNDKLCSTGRTIHERSEFKCIPSAILHRSS